MVWKYLFGSDEEKVQKPAATPPVEEVKPQKSSGGFWSNDKGEVKGVSTEGEGFVAAEVAPLAVKDLEPESTSRVLPINGAAPEAAEEGALITPPELVESTTADVTAPAQPAAEIDIHESSINTPAPAAPTAEVSESPVVLKLEETANPEPSDAPTPDLHLETNEEEKEAGEQPRPVFSAEQDSMPSIAETNEHEDAPKVDQQDFLSSARKEVIAKQEALIETTRQWIEKLKSAREETLESNRKKKEELDEVIARHRRELEEATRKVEEASKGEDTLTNDITEAENDLKVFGEQLEYMKKIATDKHEMISDNVEHGSEVAA